MMLTEIVNAVQSLVWEGGDAKCDSSSTDQKVSFVRRVLLSLKTERCATKENTHSYSPLRLLWWVSLLYGASAKMAEPFPAEIELTSLDGTNGFVIHGEEEGDSLGYSIAGVGDVNSDGLADLMISAPWASSSNVKRAGKVYVIFGSSKFGNVGIVQSSGLNGTNGFIIGGRTENNNLGASGSALGDVDGDRVADLIIGTSQLRTIEGPSLAGKAYIMLGGKGVGLGGAIDLIFQNNLFTFQGKIPEPLVRNGSPIGEYSRFEVTGLGDVNGDGFSDFLIRDSLYLSNDGKKTGKLYVLFGGTYFSEGVSRYKELDDFVASNGVVINGQKRDSRSGSSISGAGDVNGDGFDDILVGSLEDVSGMSYAGKAYLIYGKRDFTNIGTVEFPGLGAQDGTIFTGGYPRDGLGTDVSGAGDLNGDGLADFLITATGSSSDSASSGRVFVIFGKRGTGFRGNLSLANSANGMGFVVVRDNEVKASFGTVSGAGDLNGDGYDDIFVGDPDADAPQRSSAGKVYVIFGGKSLESKSIFKLSSLNGTNGFVINGEHRDDSIGRVISGAGDINGDGIDDILIGAPGASLPGKVKAGKVYVIFGRNLNPPEPSLVTSSMIPQPSIMMAQPTFMVPQATFQSSSIIAGASAGAVALLCSLVAGGVFFCWRKKNVGQNFYQNDVVQEGNPLYQNLVLAPQPNQQVGGDSDLGVRHGGGQYADWPKAPQAHNSSHYTNVNVINRQHDQYVIDKRKKAQESYDDLNI